MVSQSQYNANDGTQQVAGFVYDGANNRIQQVDYTGAQPATTTYTNDVTGLAQVLLASDGSTTTTNLFGLDLIFVDDGTAPHIMLADGLGSVRVEMVGDAVETITTYEPFGKLLAQTETSGTTYGYTGEAHDAATGLVYLRARYYNPDLKVFMSRDPFPGKSGSPASQHGYSYVHNNPVNLTDPSGHCIFGIDTFICISIAGGFVIGVITGVTYEVMVTQERGGVENVRDKTVLNPNHYCGVDWRKVAFTGGFSGAVGSVTGGLVSAGLASFFPTPDERVHPELVRPVDRGNRFHYDIENGAADGEYGPSQLRRKYPLTEFDFPRRGQSGADAEFKGGLHPSEYPNSTWPAGNDYGDFKPNTPNGRVTFGREIRSGKLPENTTPLPYDVDKLELLDEHHFT